MVHGSLGYIHLKFVGINFQIRVNCINPTIIKTELAMIAADWGNPEKAKPVLDRIPLRRFGGKLTIFIN